MTFEEKLARVEEIVSILNSGTESLERQIQIYEEGINLINECREFLQNAEKKVININSPSSTKEE
ncbi:MAG TPA: exodeoxyribonuclease VII small subunit [Candidatus Kapabacteria bacterium]|jgi:exodeoxyribonuclease VII small subunit|nr:exodeoxyribonuclease VII small subunit [Candidatus Kapabacteria bacterium]HOV91675.1 exodeoxyribonuclease VII small subunit [Candidatus Kapabacteria bacterium]